VDNTRLKSGDLRPQVEDMGMTKKNHCSECVRMIVIQNCSSWLKAYFIL